jgi:hypothetical protein
MLNIIDFKFSDTVHSAVTIDKSVNGILKKIVVNNVSACTLDIDIKNQNGSEEVILDALALTTDVVKYPKRSVQDTAGSDIADVYEDFVIMNEVTVSAGSAADVTLPRVWIIVDDLK